MEQNLAISEQMKMMQLEADTRFALSPIGQELKRFEINQRMGKMYAESTLVPKAYVGNISNCAIAIDMAMRMGANVLMVMQNLYLVNGNPAWSSKFLISTINTCGRFRPLSYECNNLTGDEYGWRAVTYAADDKEYKRPLEGTWITWRMVKAEGWDKKPGSKWTSMPEQMFKYRAAAFWQRQYAPEISMGFMTAEEANDIVEDVPFEEIPHPANKKEAKKSLRAIAAQNTKAAAPQPTTVPVETVDTETGEVTETAQATAIDELPFD